MSQGRALAAAERRLIDAAEMIAADRTIRESVVQILIRAALDYAGEVLVERMEDGHRDLEIDRIIAEAAETVETRKQSPDVGISPQQRFELAERMVTRWTERMLAAEADLGTKRDPDADMLAPLRARMETMTDDGRVALLARLNEGYCRHCGSRHLPCYCQADD